MPTSGRQFGGVLKCDKKLCQGRKGGDISVSLRIKEPKSSGARNIKKGGGLPDDLLRAEL
ncbi:hypothetical protein BJP43_10620 (plasmid) [Candidatus Williamhamiltonella defendens]|uniref:Uncharacterized protein n=1 Tax=Candidatus Williamhamiltonella defendens TaxID=138072 RepID=A0A2D3TH68_9ENTR|nr:hypothetical protein BJP43_10620 [Candidatus Hamiltonella defensa]